MVIWPGCRIECQDCLTSRVVFRRQPPGGCVELRFRVGTNLLNTATIHHSTSFFIMAGYASTNELGLSTITRSIQKHWHTVAGSTNCFSLPSCRIGLNDAKKDPQRRSINERHPWIPTRRCVTTDWVVPPAVHVYYAM